MSTKYFHINVIVEKKHRDKVEFIRYQSGKSISEIMRFAIDKLKEEDFKQK